MKTKIPKNRMVRKMKKKRNSNSPFLIVLACLALSSCVSIKRGTFTILEEGKDIGYLYRYKDLQVEKYHDDNELVFGKVKWINNKEMLLRSLYQSGNPIDTLTWIIRFSNRNNNNHYNAIGSLAYIDTIDYKYEFVTKKISRKVNKEIKEVILKNRKSLK